jgi:hypothetical protein
MVEEFIEGKRERKKRSLEFGVWRKNKIIQ